MTKWTPEAIRALGPTTDLPTLAAILECSRWKSYQMAQHNEWERLGIKVLSIGSKYRVVVQSILDVLGYGLADMAGPTDDQQSAVSPDGGPALSLTGGPSRHGWSTPDLAGISVNAILAVKRTGRIPRSRPSEKALNDLPRTLMAHRGPIWSAYQIGSFPLVRLGSG
jgi:hypothetical protein